MFLSMIKLFYNPFISSLRFSKAPDYLIVMFGGPSPLCIKFEDILPSNKSYFLMATDTKRTQKCFQEKKVAWHLKIL